MHKPNPQAPVTRFSPERPAAPDQRPEPPGKPPFALLALLKIVGPVEAPALLSQLRADLTACDGMIRRALSTDDWAAFRLASHNLVALAGTAGDSALQAKAEALNQAAHARDAAALQTLAPSIGDALAALVDLIGSLQTHKGKA